MNGQIDGVVASDVVFTEIPIQGKSQKCDGPVKLISGFPWIFRLGEKGADQGFRTQILDMQKMIPDDIGLIIELPGSIEGVGVNEKDHCSQTRQCKPVIFQNYS